MAMKVRPGNIGKAKWARQDKLIKIGNLGKANNQAFHLKIPGGPLHIK